MSMKNASSVFCLMATLSHAGVNLRLRAISAFIGLMKKLCISGPSDEG